MAVLLMVGVMIYEKIKLVILDIFYSTSYPHCILQEKTGSTFSNYQIGDDGVQLLADVLQDNAVNINLSSH